MVKVLVVDESKVMRRIVVRWLEIFGFEVSEVREARNGIEALSLLRRVSIDVVVCDLDLPEMSGVELVRRMSENRLTADLPVVMVSWHHNEAQIDELRRLGVRGYVSKPFHPEVLGRAVQQALGLTGAA